MKNNIPVVFPLSLSVNGSSVTVTDTTVGSGEHNVLASADLNGIVRKTNKNITTTVGGFSFVYGAQVGNGGFSIKGSGRINGNVYSNGPITGTAGVTINGTAISAGPTGSISGASGPWSLYVTGSAYAHNISYVTVTHDAYYKTSLINSVVNGTKYPNSVDQATAEMPISDAFITQLETTASSGPVINTACPYNVSGNVTIGPGVITCDATFDGNDKITLKGTVWIKGNLTVTAGAGMIIDSSVGNKGVAVIVDKTTDRLNSSKIVLSGGSTFTGSGGADSYVMLISMNNSAENAGSGIAIDVQGGATGSLLTYAPHGLINLSGGVSLREVTAYKTALSSGALVDYTVGVAKQLFLTGPSGSWKIKLWQEAQ